MSNDIQVIIDTAHELIHDYKNKHGGHEVDLESIRRAVERELVEEVGIDIIRKAYDVYMLDLDTYEKKFAKQSNVRKEHNAEELDEASDQLAGGLAQTRSVLRYKVIRKKYINELEDNVRDSIRAGWTPLGGVSFVSGGISPVGDFGNSFIQAMVKYKSK